MTVSYWIALLDRRRATLVANVPEGAGSRAFGAMCALRARSYGMGRMH